ncbi:hypothetical protein DMX03_20460 [Pseudomonas koreensis]|nr:hypothetical protein DMX03_20460 [Pseudomonas koreensis]
MPAQRKGNPKGFAPAYGPLAGARGTFRYGTDPGAACRRGKRSRARAKAPHPSPLPEGEGTDRGVQAKYADLRYRVECRY